MEATKQVQFLTKLCTVIGMKKHDTKLFKAYNIDSNLFIKVLMAALGIHRDYFLETKNLKKLHWKGGCNDKNLKDLIQTVSSVLLYSY